LVRIGLTQTTIKDQQVDWRRYREGKKGRVKSWIRANEVEKETRKERSEVIEHSRRREV